MTRADFELDLVDELSGDAEVVAPGIVAASHRRSRLDVAEPVFARQAMQRPQAVTPFPSEVAQTLGRLARAARKGSSERSFTWTLQVVAPDSHDPEDPRRPIAAELEAALQADPSWEPESPSGPAGEAEVLLQVWVVQPDEVWVGRTPVSMALSALSGGRSRLRRPADAVSRAGLKLEEAVHWVGVGPEKGDLCADLGAAPGGWTQVLLARGASVIAIDPKRLRVEASPKRLTHLQQSAFDFVPVETVDWVVCDMAWRPAEVARLLAKWGRRSWAQQFIANFKLPMKRKADALSEVVKVLTDGGWTGLRGRQLFHDREEVTLYGWLSAAQARQPAKEGFRLRSRGDEAAKPQRPTARKKSSGATARKPSSRKAAARKTPRKKPRKTSVKRQATETPKKER